MTPSFEAKLDQLIHQFNTEINEPTKVLQTKDMVDELIVELANCVRDFTLKKEELKGSSILAANVSHRAFFFMATQVTSQWCLEAVGAKVLKLMDQQEKKAPLHVID
jgi:hypothetical protein